MSGIALKLTRLRERFAGAGFPIVMTAVCRQVLRRLTAPLLRCRFHHALSRSKVKPPCACADSRPRRGADDADQAQIRVLNHLTHIRKSFTPR